MRTGQELYKRAKMLIPGGTQLLSKRPEMFLPDEWPSYYSRAKGASVWDLDGREYIDCGISGVSTSTLGFADEDVEKAVIAAVQAGPMSTLNTPDEVELAELLIELHPWAEMARYARSGGEIMSVAARIARAATGRDKIAFCGYHGWHDWYLAANLSQNDTLSNHLLPGLDTAGVAKNLAGTMLPFRYNDIGELKAIMSAHGEEVAAVIMEPTREVGPSDGFLEEVRAIATENESVLVFDEITSGWRINTGGIHMTYGVYPDIAVFAKAMSNGFAMAAAIGRREVMEAAQRTFISSTTWTERVGPAAALATIKKHRREKVPEKLVETGLRVRENWLQIAEANNIKIATKGIAPLGTFSIDHPQANALVTYFVQEMLDRGYLSYPKLSVTYAHTEAIIDGYLRTVEEVFPLVAQAAARGDVEDLLRGPIKHVDFRRLTD